MDTSTWLNDRTVYVTLAGSRAYGLETPDSDWDYRGAAIAPPDYHMGLLNFEQADSKGTIQLVQGRMGKYPVDNAEITIWGLKKMISLAADGNPNMIELLFMDLPDIVHCNTEVMDPFFAARESFVSRLLKHRFSGYAMQQLKRIRNHKRWMDHPPSEPTRADFGIEGVTMAKDQIFACDKLIELQVDQWLVDQTHLPEDIKIQLGPEMIRMINVILEQLQIEAKVDKLKDVLERAANRHLGFDADFINFLAKFKAYRAAKAEYKAYLTWKKQRNPVRAELERKFGYDCYLYDTEFLTESGWKTYDEISNSERLATVNQSTGQMEFEKPYERVSKSFTGIMYTFETQHTKCTVTPNHRMWVSEMHRQKSNGFSTGYVQEEAEWKILSADQIMTGSKGYFHARSSCSSKPDMSVKDSYLRLMGAYVSEGCVGKRLKDGTPSVLRISQSEEGRLMPIINQLREEFPEISRLFTSEREGTRKTEKILTIADRGLASDLVNDCGEYSQQKKLPSWVMNLSKRQVEVLLSAMVAGDGTQRPYSRIYYTSSKQLADMTQAMCVQCGVESDVWGPYQYGEETPMYQVYIGKEREIIGFNRNQNITGRVVEDARIVCFSVPNEILVTRRSGKVAIQGNTKHGMHLVRLLRMAREILETGKVLVRRHHDGEELKAIRYYGIWSYEELVEWAEQEDAALDEVMNKSKLPKSPNRKLINEILTETTFKYLNKFKS